MQKPYYKRGGITIYHGDCREIIPSLPKVDLVLTDPPYGIAFDTDYTRMGYHRKYGTGKTYPPVRGDDAPFNPQPFIALSRNVILFGANCYFDRLPPGRLLVWDKRFKNGKSFRADAEAAWMSGSGRFGVYIYSETTQGFLRTEPAEHPTQKPVGLMKWCIEKSRTAGLILDPFLGSGSTLVAARDLNREAIGIEFEERYCEIAARRLEECPTSERAAPRSRRQLQIAA